MYKKGDRVVQVNKDYNWSKVHDKGTIVSVEGDYLYIKFDHDRILDVRTEDIEFECVYNSPLYKVMTEK